MSSILGQSMDLPRGGSPWFKWWPVAAGLIALYVPMYIGLAAGPWQGEEQAHGPIVLAVVLWLAWKNRDALIATEAASRPIEGGAALAFGLACFALGRALGIHILEVGSQIPVLLGLMLMFAGWPAVRRLWIALVFLCFVIPLPGFLIETLTGTLKQYVAAIAQSSLFAFGYPVARNGVVLTAGAYQLEVANACAGLHSMYSLTAIGLLYLYLMKHSSVLRNGILAASILPIAFFVNIVRVAALVLITYQFGDEAGQGFLHGFTGIVLFAVGIGLLFALDSLLGIPLPDREKAHA